MASMTPEETIDIINDVTWEDNGRHYGKIPEARNQAIAALEKQIPKKPVMVGEEYMFEKDEWEKYYECSTCGNPYADDSFCSCCGQALDWSDTE